MVSLLVENGRMAGRLAMEQVTMEQLTMEWGWRDRTA
jgi:hypothetical protein